MTDTLTADATSLTLAFATAYDARDYDRTRELVAPALAYRELNPGGLLERDSWDTIAADAAAWAAGYDSIRVEAPAVEPINAEVARSQHRWHLVRDGQALVCDFQFVTRVVAGRIVSIDCLCAGPQPV